MGSWFDRMVTAVERVYERRLQQASGIEGLNTHANETTSPEDDEEVEIVNLPRGVAVALPAETNSAESDPASE